MCIFLPFMATSLTVGIFVSSTDLVISDTAEEVDYDESDDRRNKRRDKKGMFKDMNIVVTHREDDALDMDTDRPKSRARPSVTRERLMLEQQVGAMYFRTSDSEGPVEICVQSYVATPQEPSRIGLNITSSEETYQLFQSVVNKDSTKKTEASSDVGEMLEMESSGIQRELDRLESLVNNVFKKIQASSKRDQEFKDNVISLNKAVRYWPMFRICVVIVAGSLQLHHVLGYLKRKHIY